MGVSAHERGAVPSCRRKAGGFVGGLTLGLAKMGRNTSAAAAAAGGQVMASKPGRSPINWSRDCKVAVARELTTLVHGSVGANEGAFLEEFGRSLPVVSRRVLGDELTLDGLRDHVRRTQQREFSDNALVQRGDKGRRYAEQTAHAAAVAAAYREYRRGAKRVPAPDGSAPTSHRGRGGLHL
jgi:hypothetical protein